MRDSVNPALSPLPAELLTESAGYLDVSTRRNLVLCSRYFYALFLSVLYNEVELPDRPKFVKVAAIVQALLRKPELSCCPRNLLITAWENHGRGEERQHIDPGPDTPEEDSGAAVQST